MYNYVEYFWPAQDLQAVALIQTLGSAGTLTLNGTYVAPPSSTISFLNRGFVRNVSLTSVNNLSGVNFTISGVQNTTLVTETIAGPNNNTVYTTNAFDIISSITTNGAVTAVKAGTGLTGFFPLFTSVSSASITFTITSIFSPYAVSFATQSVNGTTTTLYQSLSNQANNGQTYAALIANASFIQKGSPYVNVTQILQFTDVIYNLLVGVTSANNSSTLQIQFLQL
jgi:hypothetical protein